MPEFKRDFIAKRIADKKDIDVEEVLKEWDLKGKVAINYGNAVHDAVQLYITYGQYPNNEHLKSIVDEFKKLDLGDRLLSEVTIGSVEMNIAGRVDIFKGVGKYNKEVDIYDIKTSTDLYKTNGNMKAPFTSFKATKYNEYALQLNLYRTIVERELGYKVRDMKLLQWTGSEFEIILPIKQSK